MHNYRKEYLSQFNKHDFDMQRKQSTHRADSGSTYEGFFPDIEKTWHLALVNYEKIGIKTLYVN